MKPNFKTKPDGEGRAGGPGGVRSQPADARAEAAEARPLDIDDARLIEDLYLRGGAAKFVQSYATLRVMQRLKAGGVIDTQENLRGGAPKVMLTVRGRQLLTQAVKLIAAAPAPARSV